MDVYVLGSGVGAPNVNRGYPGLLVDCGTERVLIDPGPGSVRQMWKLAFSYTLIDSVVITHFHPDHCLDVVSFLFACKYPLNRREKGLSIIGPEGLKKFYGNITETFGDTIMPEFFELHLKEVKEDTVRIGRARLTVKPVEHSDASIGIRYVDNNGGILCYSGDTDYCANIVELARGADLLILECSFPDEGKVKGHLTPSYAGRIASEAKAKRLLLTHLYPVCDEADIPAQCKKEFDGEVAVASDLMKVTI